MNEPRSELRLRDLGRDAEHSVDLPDLAGLQRRGRALRFRRQAGAVTAAVVLAGSALFLFQDRTVDEVPPSPAPDRVMTYPGGQMSELEAGTYEITTSFDAADPTVLVTVPEGWNSAEGPNRFVYEPDESRDVSSKTSPWLVGVLAMKLSGVAEDWCESAAAESRPVAGFDQTVRALAGLPGAERVGSARDETRFGHPATQVRVRVDPAGRCDTMSAVFDSDVDGKIGIQSGMTLDVWVVDVEGAALVVVSGSRGAVPEPVQRELGDVLASVRFVTAD